MNPKRRSKLLAILGAVAMAALLPGTTAFARGFHGPSYPGSGTHWSGGPGFSSRGRGAPFFHGSPRWFPRFGTVVTVLPDFYTTFWFGGIPYYYADGAYYLWQPDADGYVVTAPPAGAKPDSTSDHASSLDVFAYPTKGQSESQQATDRNECHAWAVGQTGADPTKAASTAKDAQSAAVRDGYLRALTACLEGRGYSVK